MNKAIANRKRKFCSCAYCKQLRNMLKAKTFHKKSKKGKVLRVVKEHYLRDDIWCSSEQCHQCQHDQPVLSATPRSTSLYNMPHYLIPDTNIFIHQMDIMEHRALENIIVLQTVLEEVKNRSFPIFKRLRALIDNKSKKFHVFSNEFHKDVFVERLPAETINDRNDRAIRVCTKWYSDHLSTIKSILLSDDRDNVARAVNEGLFASSLKDYVESLADEFPEIVDMVANRSDGDDCGPFEFEEYFTGGETEGGLKNGSLFQGKLDISSHNVFEGSIPAAIDSFDSILIIGRKNLNRAIHGDIVVVQLLPKEDWVPINSSSIVETEDSNVDAKFVIPEKNVSSNTLPLQPAGKVVSISKRNWRFYCGAIDPSHVNTRAVTGRQNVFFYPLDRKIPRIRLSTRQAQLLVGKRIVVAIDNWDRKSMHPAGHFVRTVGDIGEKSTETEVLLLEHDVPFQPFSQEVLNDLPEEGDQWKIPLEELQRRKDLRHLDICSIDPPGCTDIDDALHVVALPNGNFSVGVHIADVTYFVKPETPMDKEAAARCTTVYLVDRRIDMLPPLLGTNLCSLHCNVDRLAFSCVWEMTPEAEIVNVEFFKSIICSKASFTYEQAQQRIDNKELSDSLTSSIRILNSLAKILKKNRLNAGALTLASPEVRFNLEHDSQDPVDIEMKALKETNALVEEFMLLANISVAKKIFSTYPETSLLRRHPKPTESRFESLKRALIPFSITLDTTNSKTLSDSLDLAVIPEDAYFNTLLRILVTRCMQQAKYFASGTMGRDEFCHYGLATDIYTHFTSPIRRYCDVIVHRLLGAAIGEASVANAPWCDKILMKELTEVMNYRHTQAQMAARTSVELYTHIYFREKSTIEDAYVTRILKNGFLVIIPKYGLEGPVFLMAKDEAVPYTFDPTNQCIVTADTRTPLLKLFQKCQVQIKIEGGIHKSAGEATNDPACRSRLVISLVQPQLAGFCTPSEMKEDISELKLGEKRKRQDML